MRAPLPLSVDRKEGSPGLERLLTSHFDSRCSASVDNSVLLAQLSLTSARAPPVPQLRIPHPAPVRSVLPLASAFRDSPYLVTGASDELLRLIDLSASAALDPNPARETKREWRGLPLAANARVEGCAREVEAHTHEIVQLCAYVSRNGQQWLLSASLDNTLRRWEWPDVLVREMDKVLVVREEQPEESLLTEEEERELAELMDGE